MKIAVVIEVPDEALNKSQDSRRLYIQSLIRLGEEIVERAHEQGADRFKVAVQILEQ